MSWANALVLDTHVFLWFYAGVRVSKRVVRHVERAATANELFDGALVTADTEILDYAEKVKAVRVLDPS
jgi:hypothetical protein